MSRQRTSTPSPEPSEDLELERLLREAAPDEADRALLEEAHRQLEKDLLRLADPLPPGDFVSAVMAKVEAEPKKVPVSEVVSAIAIAVGALVASAVAFVASGASPDGVAVSFAQTFVSAREVLVGCGSALAAVWRTAGLPLSIMLGMVVMVTLVGFRRLVAPMNEKVVS
jgi:hypothetical protein